MAQKGRNNLVAAVNEKVYDNQNKEIIARYIREVFEDYRDSHFNLVDDRLKNLLYENNKTLEQKLNEGVNSTPLWGATQHFDPGSQNGDMSGNNQGIVTSTEYNRLNSSSCEVTILINPEKSISGRKLLCNVVTESSSMNDQNDLCVPVIRYISSTKLIIGIREVASKPQSIRVEVFAFNIQN